jgi:hypothetical protein
MFNGSHRKKQKAATQTYNGVPASAAKQDLATTLGQSLESPELKKATILDVATALPPKQKKAAAQEIATELPLEQKKAAAHEIATAWLRLSGLIPHSTAWRCRYQCASKAGGSAPGTAPVLAVANLVRFLGDREADTASPQVGTVGAGAVGLVGKHPVQAGPREPLATDGGSPIDFQSRRRVQGASSLRPITPSR